MADIELVIKIPKAEYELIVNDEACGLNILTRAIANGTPLDDIKAEFISQYPQNVYGDLELGGRCCVFSLNKVLEIIDKHMKGCE